MDEEPSNPAVLTWWQRCVAIFVVIGFGIVVVDNLDLLWWERIAIIVLFAAAVVFAVTALTRVLRRWQRN